MNTSQDRERPITIAVVGDVHDQWDADDGKALQHLGVDLVLLVGDFGNEAVEVVRAIAHLDIPKAVILGNHDAWYTASDWGRKQSPYDHRKEDRVQQQLDLLGPAHVGYGTLDFPDLNLSVIGSRPFSWGGSVWKNEGFYRTRYGIRSFEESAARIVAAAEQATCETLVCVAHCGPLGLGDRPEDPCGRDWNPIGGDHGDPDLQMAIAQIQQSGRRLPLVTFGHMHHNLRHTQEHRRTALCQDAQGTLYLNAARVPRIRREGTETTLRNFSLVTLEAGVVTRASLVWVDQNFAIAAEEVLLSPAQVLV